MKPLTIDFYQRPTVTVAQDLLGCLFVRLFRGVRLVGRVVETEAYHQVGDAACHAHKGKTARNRVMFETGGKLYVYFTYGMHFCMNVVTEAEGVGSAVLLRAFEPLEGLEIMHKHRVEKRVNKATLAVKELCSGPAKVCQAFAISTAQNGHNLSEEPIQLFRGESFTQEKIGTSGRIGISQAAALPWRFYIKDNNYVSR